MQFVVRNIPAATNLDGAFRIHLSPEALPAAGLTFNEPCQIVDEGGNPIGGGIAWRAADKMGAAPKSKPARMSETLREAFGIKEGSLVTLQPHKCPIVHADSLWLTDVTPDELIMGHEKDMRDGKWQTRVRSTLVSAEAIASGTTFDVVAKKGIKKRFVVERIDPKDIAAGSPSLCYVDDHTDVHFSDSIAGPPLSPGAHTNGCSFTPLSTDGIGGLIEQIETLNTSMRLVLEEMKPKSSCRNYPVLLHGYEGTGKTMLLNHMGRCGFRKVLRLDKRMTASATKASTAIADTFEEARSHQPSLILIDNLHLLAPSSDDKPHQRVLCEELDNIKGSRVLVAAATRSLHEVHKDLLGAGRFVDGIELPIPDLKARSEVLSAILKDDPSHVRDCIPNLSSRTHGFTCEDLAKLVDIARRHRVRRSPANFNPSYANGPQPNGRAHDANENTKDISADPEDIDWNYALTQVRPAALREIFFETPKIRWSDIGGSEPVRAQLDEIIGWPLRYPELMKKHKLPAQKGMLLYGPPGCSKTLTAQAVAANYEMNFIAVKGAELISMYVGESERSVREIFRKARAAKPCIIFFDEIDSIASERDAAGTKGLNVLTTLLNEMDGFEALDGVFVLAATNKPQVLDPAIMRPGRFDQHLYLGPPNKVARKEILELRLSDEGREDDFDTAKLVHATSGYTGAELVAVCVLAKRTMFRRMLAGQGSTIRMDDFEGALVEIQPQTTREVLEGYEAFARRRR